MATTTKKSNTKSTTAKSSVINSKTTVASASEQPVQVPSNDKPVSVFTSVEQAGTDTTRSDVPKKVNVSLNDIVYVQSCFHGDLFYRSKRNNGFIVEWQQFGEEQPVDVDELMYMRNTQPTFFKEQWIRLVGDNADDVFEFLHLDRYCKNNLKFDDFDDVFAMESDEIEMVVKSFTPSLRESFARRALELIETGELDNLKKIQAIERASGYSLLK